MTFYISLIVEGQTEVDCIERLLHRVWNETLTFTFRLQVLPASRAARASLTHVDATALELKVEEARLKLDRYLGLDSTARGCIILLLDAEDECPAILGPRLTTALAGMVPAAVLTCCALAKSMFENWIVAGAKTLGGVNGLPDVIPSRKDFENFNGATWLEKSLRGVNNSRKYKKTEDAKVFVNKMDLAECCCNSPSFNRLVRKLRSFIDTQLNSSDGAAAS